MSQEPDDADQMEASRQHLIRLHKAICEKLANKAELDSLTPAELKEARQMLADNRIRTDAPGFSRARGPTLVDGLPFRQPDEEGGEEYREAVGL